MKPTAFLPSSSPWPSSAPSVPATPIAAAAGPARGVRHLVKHPVLDLPALIASIDSYLRDNRDAPRAHRLELINMRHRATQQLEKDNPIPEEDLRLIAERLGRKAQSGWSPLSLPEPLGSSE